MTTTNPPEAPGRCGYCGRRAPSGRARCSTGCSLAARVPLGGEGLPASWQLGVALGLFFAVFNQALLASVAALAARKGELAAAGQFGIASLAFGGAVAAANLALFLAARPKRLSDALAWTLAIGVALLPRLDGRGWGSLGFAAAFSAGNALMACWLGRALLRRWLIKTPENR